MQHVIKNAISQEQIDMLRSIKDASSLNLYIDEVGDFALNFSIESPDRTINVKNIPINASDGDDYPKLIIEHVPKPRTDFKLMYTGKNLKNILIWRHVVSWKHDSINWMVEADIGIEIDFQQEEFLLLAQDSLGGLLKVYRLNKATPVEDILEDYWSMKTDKIDSFKRQEIQI